MGSRGNSGKLQHELCCTEMLDYIEWIASEAERSRMQPPNETSYDFDARHRFWPGRWEITRALSYYSGLSRLPLVSKPLGSKARLPARSADEFRVGEFQYRSNQCLPKNTPTTREGQAITVAQWELLLQADVAAIAPQSFPFTHSVGFPPLGSFPTSLRFPWLAQGRSAGWIAGQVLPRVADHWQQFPAPVPRRTPVSSSNCGPIQPRWVGAFGKKARASRKKLVNCCNIRYLTLTSPLTSVTSSRSRSSFRHKGAFTHSRDPACRLTFVALPFLSPS